VEVRESVRDRPNRSVPVRAEEEIFPVPANHVARLQVGEDVLGVAIDLVECRDAQDGHVDPRHVAGLEHGRDAGARSRRGILVVDPELHRAVGGEEVDDEGVGLPFLPPVRAAGQFLLLLVDGPPGMN
jgi:hypothetical protein